MTVLLASPESVNCRFVTLAEILSGDFHPALKQAVRDMAKRDALGALCVAVTEHPGDSELVARLAHDFVKARGAAVATPERVKVKFLNGKYEIAE